MKKQLLSCGFLLLFLIGSFQSHAQDNTTTIRIGEGDIKSASKARSIGYSNTLTPMAVGLGAIKLSDNSTVEKIGAGFTVYGLLVGPSTANFYGSDYMRGMLGVLVRGVGGYMMIDASREIFGNDFADALGVDQKEVSLTDTKILIGEVLVLGSIVYNILSAKASIREYNNRSKMSVRLDSENINNKMTPVLTARIQL